VSEKKQEVSVIGMRQLVAARPDFGTNVKVNIFCFFVRRIPWNRDDRLLYSKAMHHYTTLHYTTLHYTTLHYTTLHYTTVHSIISYHIIYHISYIISYIIPYHISYNTIKPKRFFSVCLSVCHASSTHLRPKPRPAIFR
jgi:hypothetical protein